MQALERQVGAGKTAPWNDSRGGKTAAWALGLALVLGGLEAPDLAAQDDDETRRQGIFIDTVDVSLINVEVRATSKDGTPVADLTVDDFEIFDDGQPMEITNFYRVASGRRIMPETPQPAAASDIEGLKPDESDRSIRDDEFTGIESREGDASQVDADESALGSFIRKLPR